MTANTLQPPTSLSDLRALVADFPGSDVAAADAARARDAELTKPAGSLGRLEEIAVWLAGWQGQGGPRAEHIQVLVFAGNHGVAARGVSAFPPDVTVQMVANFQAGGAAINQLAAAAGATLDVVALDLDRPTADFTQEPAMSEADCVAAIAQGMASVDMGADLVCIGEMGIANTTVAAALANGLFGGAAADWVGPGTGVDDSGLARKRDAVAAALDLHRDALGDPLEVLRRLGGREIAAMLGATVAARYARVPVLVDGFVATAAVAPLSALKPGALDHCLASHCSAEPAHRRLMDRLGKQPLLDLGMRLGEASGAAVAAGIVRAAALTHTGMATFGDAGVSSGTDR